MDKKKTLKKREGCLTKRKSPLTLKNFGDLKRIDPLKQLVDPKKTAMAVFECLLNNDPKGAMEMLEIYLYGLNKAKLLKKNKLAKSTMYSALKHGNPTIKTLAKIMHQSAHGTVS